MLLLAAAPAAAQEAAAPPEEAEAPPDVDEVAPIERARARFAAGVEHAAAQRWARAIDAFEEALELHRAAAIEYNLAAALVESGRYRDAHGHLLALEGDPEAGEDLLALGRGLRERMDAEAGRLRIERRPTAAGAEVLLDTIPVPEEVLATPIPVREGEHRVAVVDGPRTLDAQTIVARAGAVTDVRLGPESAVEDPAIPLDPATPIVEEPLFWVAIGGGVLLVVGAIVLGVVLASESGQDPVAGDFSPAIVTFP